MTFYTTLLSSLCLVFMSFMYSCTVGQVIHRPLVNRILLSPQEASRSRSRIDAIASLSRGDTRSRKLFVLLEALSYTHNIPRTSALACECTGMRVHPRGHARMRVLNHSTIHQVIFLRQRTPLEGSETHAVQRRGHGKHCGP